MSRTRHAGARWKPTSRWRDPVDVLCAAPVRRCVRFEGLEIDRRSGAPIGVIQLAHRALRDAGTPAASADELRRILAWFGRHLPVPRRFSHHRDGQRRTGAGGWVRQPIAISWLRADALDAKRQARRLAALLRELGVEVRERTILRPGYVTYEDAQQVVAVPFRRA